MKIAIDAHGGDYAPDEILKGCALALEKYPDVELVIAGDRQIVQDALHSLDADCSRIEARHTTQLIGMAESPVAAIKGKKDSSMVKALQAVAQGEADAFVSAGNTGAVLAGATMIVRRIRGVKRPALAPLLPTSKGTPVMLIDCGANVECKPEHLAQFGVIGSIYMARVMGVESPRVGLINNGAEAEKGNDLTKAAYRLLENMPVNFVGNIEARDINTGAIDVAVCDGFVGNVALKLTEGLASSLFAMMKEEFAASMRSKLGAMLLKPAFKQIKKKMDYTEYGGALFLGVNGGVVKAHGSSNAKAIAAAINQAREMVLSDVVGVIRTGISELAPEDLTDGEQ
ncbi:MAG: phosphate acyltransferase PlsX [Bacillota bacterium]